MGCLVGWAIHFSFNLPFSGFPFSFFFPPPAATFLFLRMVSIRKYICVLGSLFIPSMYIDCIPYISSLIGYIIEVTPPH